MNSFIRSISEANAWKLFKDESGKKQQIVLDYICLRANDLISDKSYLELTEAQLIRFLSAPGFNITEDEALDIAVEWIIAKGRNFYNSQEIVSCIKVPYLTAEGIRKHGNFLGTMCISWESEATQSRDYRYEYLHPSRKISKYQPRKLEIISKRWSVYSRELVLNPKEDEPFTLFPKYFGHWTGITSGVYFSFTFILETELGDLTEKGSRLVKGKIIWRLTHFEKKQENVEYPEFYIEYSDRFTHKEDEIVEGEFFPESGVLALQGIDLEAHPYPKDYNISVIDTDIYRTRLVNGGLSITGVTKGPENCWTNPFDAVVLF